MSQAVSAAPMPKQCPMATRAVEIIVVFSGLSREPISSGAVSRALNPGPSSTGGAGRGAATGAPGVTSVPYRVTCRPDGR